MCQTSNERRWLASTNRHLFIRFNIFSSCFSNNSTEEDQLGEVCVGPVKGLSDKRLPGWLFLRGNWSQLHRIFKVFTYSFLRLMAEILHHFWLDGISLHPLNLNIGGIQMQETDAVMNGWNPAPPSMSSQHWNYGGCRGKHQRCYNAIHGRRCRISAINRTTPWNLK